MRTEEGKWIAFSAASTSALERVFEAIGRPELSRAERFRDVEGRTRQKTLLGKIVQEWISQHSRGEVLEVFGELDAPIVPVYGIAGILQDPHFVATGLTTTVVDEQLGSNETPEVQPRLLRTPGRARFSAPPVGGDNDEVWGRLGVGPGEFARLRDEGVI